MVYYQLQGILPLFELLSEKPVSHCIYEIYNQAVWAYSCVHQCVTTDILHRIGGHFHLQYSHNSEVTLIPPFSKLHTKTPILNASGNF